MPRRFPFFPATFLFVITLGFLTFAAIDAQPLLAQAQGTSDSVKSVLRNGATNTHVENVQELNSPLDDASIVISPDESTLYFTSYRDGNKPAIFVSHRESKTTWGKPQKFADLPGKESISSISVSTDGMHAIMACCNRADGIQGSCDLYDGEITDGKVTNIRTMGRGINTEWWEGQPCLSQDGQLLFFASDRKHGMGGIDIYMCARNADGAWGDPVDLSFNTGGNDMAPIIASDNQTLYFASDGIAGGMGGYDIYVTHRTGPNTWTEPKNLGPAVNSKGNDLFFVIPPAEDAVYVSSDRQGTAGGYDIFRIVPNPIVEAPKIIAFHGSVLDAETGLPVKSSPQVEIAGSGANDTIKNFEQQGTTYSAVVPLGALIHVKAVARGYVNGSMEVQAPSERNPEGFAQDIKLAVAHAVVEGHVINAFSHKALPTTVRLSELENDTVVKSTQTAETKADGSFSFNATPGAKYRIATEVKDYNPYEVDFDIPVSSQPMLHVQKEVNMTPSDIKAVIVHFDYDKSDLKESEKPNLEHFIVQVKENPDVKILLHGYTDERGTEEYNQKLSESRAAAVQDYLLSRGVPQDQLAVVQGFGKTQLVDTSGTEEGQAKNRRVEVRIMGRQ